MTHPTDEELDALVRAINYSTRDHETGDDLHPGVFVHLSVEDAVAASVAITALRAQLARREEMHDCAMKERDDAALYADEQKARADRAEAALAAQIEVERVQHIKRGSTYRVLGRGKVQTDDHLTDYDEVVIYQGETDGLIWARPVKEFEDGRFTLLHTQPHDRTALDRLLAEAREQALREAAAVANNWQNETGTDISAAARICPQIADAILALIDGDKI